MVFSRLIPMWAMALFELWNVFVWKWSQRPGHRLHPAQHHHLPHQVSPIFTTHNFVAYTFNASHVFVLNRNWMLLNRQMVLQCFEDTVFCIHRNQRDWETHNVPFIPYFISNPTTQLAPDDLIFLCCRVYVFQQYCAPSSVNCVFAFWDFQPVTGNLFLCFPQYQRRLRAGGKINQG